MTYGYRNQDGEIVETNHIVNCLWPAKPKIYGFYYKQGHYMKLKPVDKNIVEGLWWECQCKCISLLARNNCFTRYKQLVIETFNLNKLDYDISTDNWTIEGQWVSPDDNRLNAVKRKIGKAEQEDILDELQSILEAELGVTFESWGDFVVFIIMAINGMLMQFTIKSPFFEMTSILKDRIESVQTDVKESKTRNWNPIDVLKPQHTIHQ